MATAEFAGRGGLVNNDVPQDFGEHGEFLEESVKIIVNEKPDALAFSGILPDGEYIGGFHNASVNDRFLMAGNILLDIFMDFIRRNAAEIRAILENTDEEGGDVLL